MTPLFAPAPYHMLAGSMTQCRRLAQATRLYVGRYHALSYSPNIPSGQRQSMILHIQAVLTFLLVAALLGTATMWKIVPYVNRLVPERGEEPGPPFSILRSLVTVFIAQGISLLPSTFLDRPRGIASGDTWTLFFSTAAAYVYGLAVTTRLISGGSKRFVFMVALIHFGLQLTMLISIVWGIPWTLRILNNLIQVLHSLMVSAI